MAIDRVPVSTSIWPVHVPVRDEYMGEVLSSSDDHFVVLAGLRFDLGAYARTQDLAWLVRADASLVFPRADGSAGTLFPDLLVAFDVEVPGDGPYRIMEVGKPPELVAEILSDETAAKDMDAVAGKVAAYAEMGIHEYLTFDPRPRKHLALVGFRLVRPGQYQVIPPAPEGGLWLETLGLRVATEPGTRRPRRELRLRFHTAERLPLLHVDEVGAQWRAEQTARKRAERAQAQAERAQAQAEQAQARTEQDRMRLQDELLRAQQRNEAILAELARLRHERGPTKAADEPT